MWRVMPLDCAITSVWPALRAVATPAELMLAIAGLVTDQVTELVMFEVVGLAEPICDVAIAVYCAV